jgi:acyl-CoA thioesterase superfamily protein/acyl-Coa thioesterase superfamily protein
MVVSSDFFAATALERIAPSSFRAQIPDGWQQGRGAFGGLVLAILLRAMEAAEPDRGRSARTVSGDLCGPALPGPADISVRVLRRGKNQTNVAAELRQDDQVLALASAVLSTPRPQPPSPVFEGAPADADWRGVPALEVAPPIGPAFAAHYEYRSDEPPFAVSGAPRIAGWVRERKPLPRLDAPALIGRLDAWWPTLFHVAAPRPVATVSFVAELLVDPATLPADEPLRYRARMAALHEGFFVELRELWQGERLVALNQQTFAIIK